MITGWGLLGIRDQHGIRPLVYGKRDANEGVDGHVPAWEYMMASESGALTALGFTLIGDVPAGAALLMPRGGTPRIVDCLPAERPPLAPCVFEYVYFARPDSVLDGVSVYRTRLRMGEKLARKILREWRDHDIDVVIPVPDTARTAALECAAALGIKYREGFIKNRYVGRTFIMPAQGLRKKSVRQKLSPIASEFAGRNILLVDDSIVRGTTSKQIIQMSRDAGAKKVYIASAAPPVRFPNVYGIDMPTKAELLATRSSDMEGIAKEIGADRIVYQDLVDLQAAITEEAADCGSALRELDCSCFNGQYVTKSVNTDYLEALAKTRTSDRGGGDMNSTHELDVLNSSGTPSPRSKSPKREGSATAR